MASDCFFIRTERLPGIAGNANFMRMIGMANASKYKIRRNAAIGDSICASVVADRLIEMGSEVEWQTHSMIVPLMRLHPRLQNVRQTGGMADINLDDAYENARDKKDRHFHELFFRVANQQLSMFGVNLGKTTNCRPRLVVAENDREALRSQLSKYAKPWVFICPRSQFYPSRTVGDGVWGEVAKGIRGTLFWLGLHGPPPKNVVDLQVRNVLRMAQLVSIADLLITVDTGPMHVAAAMDIPCLVIEQSSLPKFHLTDQNDYDVVTQPLQCLHCMALQCPKNRHNPPCSYPDPNKIIEKANWRLGGTGKVSVIMPTYKAPGKRINKALGAVIDQVDEIIVSCDAGGSVPPDLMVHPKVRVVQSWKQQLGFGKNVNFGFRHTRGEFVLSLNDDCYLAANAVKLMMDEMLNPDVGLVGHFLRYPDGRICHGGKFRNPGMKGWGLRDNREFHPTIKEPCFMENVTGTSMLFRRKAFYHAGCFDEDFFMYAEDDALCLQLRRAGWRIRYTPLAKGVHDEAATSRAVARRGDIMPWVHDGNRAFAQKWAWWFQQYPNENA
jgi:GT2 family glycosyltransferase